MFPTPPSKSVPAFIDPNPPPPTIPVLSSHIYLLSTPHVILTSQAELCYTPATILPPSATPKSNVNSQPLHRPTAANNSTAPRVTKLSSRPAESSSTASDDNIDDASSESSLTSLESDTNKIPKPEGEAGRPGRGGYNLEAQLAWSAGSFSKLKKFVHRSIKRHLDTGICRSRQNDTLIQLVIQEALREFPDLDDYHGCWPVQDLILLRLKYTSGRARLAQRLDAGNIKVKKVKT